MKDILVCLEGSTSSERAIDLGLELAREHGARLVGLAIIDDEQQREDALVEDARQKAAATLAQFETRCQQAGVTTRSLELRGRAAAMILAEMTEHDLTLIGRRANFLFEAKVEDATTRDNVLHNARKPVLVVPEQVARAGHDVLIAFDGSSAAKRAIRAFGESGMAQGRAIHVTSMDDDGEQAWEMASRGVDLLRELSISAKPRSLVSQLSIADALLDLRRRLGAGLMVMGAYTRSRLGEMLWGSVTREMIDKTPVPLFLHH